MSIYIQAVCLEDFWLASDAGLGFNLAWNRAMAALPASGGRIYLDNNSNFTFVSTIVIDRPIEVVGRNPGLTPGSLGPPTPGGQRLVFNTVAGIKVNAGLGMCIFRNLNMWFAGSSNAILHGIESLSPVIIEGCLFFSFPGDGIRLTGKASEGSDVRCSMIRYNRSYNAGGWGLHIEGDLAYGCKIFRNDTTFCGQKLRPGGPVAQDPTDGGGVWDNATVGANIFARCHTSNNDGPAVCSTGGNSSIFLDYYTEADIHSLTFVEPPGLILGGNLAEYTSAPPKLGTTNSTAGFYLDNPMWISNGALGAKLRFCEQGTQYFMQWSCTDDPISTGSYVMRTVKIGGTEEVLAWDYNENTALRAMYMTTDVGTVRDGGLIVFPRGYLVGEEAFGGLREASGTAPPATDATHSVGDVFWKSAIASGTPQYWRCTAKDGSNNLTWVAGPNQP